MCMKVNNSSDSFSFVVTEESAFVCLYINIALLLQTDAQAKQEQQNGEPQETLIALSISLPIALSTTGSVHD